MTMFPHNPLLLKLIFEKHIDKDKAFAMIFFSHDEFTWSP